MKLPNALDDAHLACSKTMTTTIEPELLELAYRDSYWYAQAVHTLVHEWNDHTMAVRNEFFGDGNEGRLFGAFPRWTILHDLIHHVIIGTESADMPDEIDEEALLPRDDFLHIEATPLEEELRRLEIAHSSFVEWAASENLDPRASDGDTFSEYYESLGELSVYQDRRETTGARGILHERIVDEVFFLTFINRGLLSLLQHRAAFYLERLKVADMEEGDRRLFRKDGVLKRAPIPKWAKKAVFFRDRGRCVLCNRDLSGIISLQSSANFDHILPLALSGTNDVTNLQLLCLECNTKKSHRHAGTRSTVERWFSPHPRLKSRR